MNKLEQMLLEGLESGDPIPATPEFWEKMRQDLIERNQTQIDAAVSRCRRGTCSSKDIPTLL